MPLRIALASCSSLPEDEADDSLLEECLVRLGCNVSNPDWRVRTVEWASYDAVLIRTTWDYVPHREEFVHWAKTINCRRLWNAAEVIEWTTDKRYLRELETANVPIVPTLFVDSLDLSSCPQGSRVAFLKPAIGASASGTLRFRIDDEESVENARNHVANMPKPMLLQPYLSSVQTKGERSAIYIDGEVTHYVKKTPGDPNDYRVQDDLGGLDELHSPSKAEIEFVQCVLRFLRDRKSWGKDQVLYARIDWLLDDDEMPRLVELELAEPSLFFRYSNHAAERMAKAIVASCIPPPPPQILTPNL